MTVVFVIGNGTSPKDIDLYPRKITEKYMLVMQCLGISNRLSVAVDVKMILEITHKWQMEHEVWTHSTSNHGMQGFRYFQPAKVGVAVPTALWLASTHAHDTIYILGFDFPW